MKESYPVFPTATTLPIFDQTKMGYLPVLEPPQKEQDAICEFLDAELTNLSHLSGVIEQQISTLLAYRKSLIHECVTGQRRVTEEDLNRVLKNG